MRKLSALLRMIARSTTQHLFASVEGEERTVPVSPQANQTPYEYSQVTVPESNIDSLPVMVPAVEEKVFSRVTRHECYGRQRPWRIFLHECGKNVRAARLARERTHLLLLSCRCEFGVFSFHARSRTKNTVCSHTIDACFLVLPGISKIVSLDPK